MSDRVAPEGHMFVCTACGKTSTTRYGIDGERSRGWDESCMLNAVLCRPCTPEEESDTGCKWWFVADDADSDSGGDAA
jgi:hypothetical protein